MLQPSGFKLVSAVALIVLLAFVVVSAETVHPLKYDASSEVKMKGVIDEVKAAVDNTVHVLLKNDKGSFDIVVAPEKFLKEMGITFAKGNIIEVLGSQVTVDGIPVMLTRQVTCNGDVMIMRDEKGKPVWEGWSR